MANVNWLDHPAIQNLIGNSPILVLAFILVIFILKMGKDIKVKLGNNEINLSTNKEAMIPVVKTLTDYADWKADLQKEYSKDFESINKEAKRLSKLSLDNWSSKLQAEFEQNYRKLSHPKQIELTDQCIKLIMYKLTQETMGFLMGIYEVNHLHEKDQSSIDDLVEVRYSDLIALYHLNIQTYWIKGMVPAEVFFDTCKSLKDQGKELLKSTIMGYKKLSSKKYELDVGYSKLDKEVKEYVINSTELPIDAYSRLHDLYKENL